MVSATFRNKQNGEKRKGRALGFIKLVKRQRRLVTTGPGNCRKRPGRVELVVELWWSLGDIQATFKPYSAVDAPFSPATLRRPSRAEDPRRRN